MASTLFFNMASRAKSPSAGPAPPLKAIEPMLLQEQDRPFDDPAYTHELKFDGYRVLAESEGVRVALRSRNGADATTWFPEIGIALAMLGPHRHVFDAEVCVLDEFGRSDFDRLHRRARRRRLATDTDPVVLCVFDLLVHRSVDIRSKPLTERRKLLESVLAKKLPSVLLVAGVPGESGVWLYQQACALELEGIVSKRLDSVYESGVRSSAWIKVKSRGAIPPERFRRSSSKRS